MSVSSGTGCFSPRGIKILMLRRAVGATSLACLVLFKVELQRDGVECLQRTTHVD